MESVELQGLNHDHYGVIFDKVKPSGGIYSNLMSILFRTKGSIVHSTFWPFIFISSYLQPLFLLLCWFLFPFQGFPSLPFLGHRLFCPFYFWPIFCNCFYSPVGNSSFFRRILIASSQILFNLPLPSSTSHTFLLNKYSSIFPPIQPQTLQHCAITIFSILVRPQPWWPNKLPRIRLDNQLRGVPQRHPQTPHQRNIPPCWHRRQQPTRPRRIRPYRHASRNLTLLHPPPSTRPPICQIPRPETPDNPHTTNRHHHSRWRLWRRILLLATTRRHDNPLTSNHSPLHGRHHHRWQHARTGTSRYRSTLRPTSTQGSMEIPHLHVRTRWQDASDCEHLRPADVRSTIGDGPWGMESCVGLYRRCGCGESRDIYLWSYGETRWC